MRNIDWKRIEECKKNVDNIALTYIPMKFDVLESESLKSDLAYIIDKLKEADESASD